MFPFMGLFSSQETSLHCDSEPAELHTTGNVSYTLPEFVRKHCPTLFKGFKPSVWLPNGHSQTAYCVLGNFNDIDPVKYDRKYIRLADGGTLGLDFTPPFDQNLDPTTPIIVIEHGLTGGSYEAYVRHILATACAPKSDGGLGYRGVVINFRGCAGVPITSPRLYSAACTDDYASGVLFVERLFPQAKKIGLGFSLGANVVTRYLGEEGKRSRLIGGCALACPWNLVDNSDRLEGTWFNRTIYSNAMGGNILKLWKGHLSSIEKFKGTTVYALIPQVNALKSPKLIDVDELVVSKSGGRLPIWPFKTAREYYEYASSHKLLPGIQVPFLAINAADDPIVRSIPKPGDGTIKSSGYAAVAITPGGGHLGWFEDSSNGSKSEIRRWIKGPVLEWMRALVEEYVSEPGQGGLDTEVVDGFTREIGREYVGYKEIDAKELPSGPAHVDLTSGL